MARASDDLSKAYLDQLTLGCGRVCCLSAHCAGNPLYRQSLRKNCSSTSLASLNTTAGSEGFFCLRLMASLSHRRGTSQLCKPIPQPLTLARLRSALNTSGQYSTEMKRNIRDVFQNAEALSSSFISAERAEGQCRVDLAALRQAYAH
eukprot:m.655509 g.655509  ORF g.655509 m.655509 type:complete len:148 (+) comp58421_c0_seq4:252-695(+)